MPSNFRSKIHSGPVKRSCVSVAAMGGIQSGNSAMGILLDRIYRMNRGLVVSENLSADYADGNQVKGLAFAIQNLKVLTIQIRFLVRKKKPRQSARLSSYPICVLCVICG